MMHTHTQTIMKTSQGRSRMIPLSSVSVTKPQSDHRWKEPPFYWIEDFYKRANSHDKNQSLYQSVAVPCLSTRLVVDLMWGQSLLLVVLTAH